MPDTNAFTTDFEEAARDVADYMASHPDSPPGRGDTVETITIKFGKGLVGEPFTGKSGKEFVEILIPNKDPEDKRPWQTFVLESRNVHANKFGKGMWARIPADGHTTVRRAFAAGEIEGKKHWEYEKRTVPQQGTEVHDRILQGEVP